MNSEIHTRELQQRAPVQIQSGHFRDVEELPIRPDPCVARKFEATSDDLLRLSVISIGNFARA